MSEILDHHYLGNSLLDYLIAAAIILGSIVMIRIFRSVILKRLKVWADASETKVDDLLVNGIEKFGLPLLNLLAFYLGYSFLEFSTRIDHIIDVAIKVVITYFFVRIISFSINHSLNGYFIRQEGGEEKIKQLRGVMIFFNILLWLIGIILLAENLGYNVATIIAGLGVGGIAVALAAQTILGDLFNYFVIFFDRPFEIGDFIIVDDKMGTIERIGIKTTRIISLGGEQIVFSNSDLTGSRIHNYKRMARRRILFSLGVTYNTPYDKLKKIPEIIRNVIEGQSQVQFDRAHFSSYGDFSLNMEVVYYVLSGDYNKYMDIQQSINLLIYQEFEKEGIEFAFPTQSLYVEKLPTVNTK